jgi:hypothetical protein
MIEDYEVKNIGGQHDWPADQQALRGEPDADPGGEKAGKLNPVRYQVMMDYNPETHGAVPVHVCFAAH